MSEIRAMMKYRLPGSTHRPTNPPLVVQTFQHSTTIFQSPPKATFPACSPLTSSSFHLQLHGAPSSFLKEPCTLTHPPLMPFPRAFYPFFQNTNCPQGSAQMSPLRKISPNPKSKQIILFLASYQHVVSMSGISLSCS